MPSLLVVLGSLAAAQSPPFSVGNLEGRYARFLGAEGARRYFQELPFEVGASDEKAVELRVKGQTYRVELVAIHDADDCETCGGVVDALVFRDGAPFLLEKGVFESGSHGRAYTGNETAVVPLTQDSEGLAITGEMWAARGCKVLTADLFGIDVAGRALKHVFARTEESCEGEETLVKGLSFGPKGFDSAGHGLFLVTVLDQKGHREEKTTEKYRFDPARWTLVPLQ